MMYLRLAFLALPLLLGSCQTSEYNLGARARAASEQLRDKPADPKVIIIRE